MDLRSVSKELFQQLVELGEQLDNAKFTKKLELLMGSSIGQHYRHIVEFYDCLKNGSAEALVSYDNRAHDKSLEENLSGMIEKLNELKTWVLTVDNNPDLQLEVSYPLSNMPSVQITSNMDRELVYNIEHAIHHMAIIKIAVIQHYPQVRLSDHFGVAQSTVVYQESLS